MAVTFGGRACVDPLSALETCQRLQLPTSWHEEHRPNRYQNPLGCQSGTGYILLLRGDLDTLDLNSQHDLVFRQRIQGRVDEVKTSTFKNLHVVEARNLSPGRRLDANACYLVELADRRRLARWSAINRGYNVPVPSDPDSFLADTLNSGSPWTWTTLVADLWSSVGTLGSFPGLPESPNGSPLGLEFHGTQALDALDYVLARLGCALKWDNETGIYSIIQTGAADSTLTSNLSANTHLRFWDGEIIRPAIGRYPETCRVLFPKHGTAGINAGTAAYYPVDITDPSGTPTGVVAGTVAQIYDDLPAEYNAAGTLQNLPVLTLRAHERATDFFASLRVDPRSEAYSAPLKDAGLAPGSRLGRREVADPGGGVFTALAPLQLSAPPEASRMEPFWGLAVTPLGHRIEANAASTANVLYYNGTSIATSSVVVEVINLSGTIIIEGSYCLAVRDPYSGRYWIMAARPATSFDIVTDVCVNFGSDTVTVEHETIDSDGNTIRQWCETNPTGCCYGSGSGECASSPYFCIQFTGDLAALGIIQLGQGIVWGPNWTNGHAFHYLVCDGVTYWILIDVDCFEGNWTITLYYRTSLLDSFTEFGTGTGTFPGAAGTEYVDFSGTLDFDLLCGTSSGTTFTATGWWTYYYGLCGDVGTGSGTTGCDLPDNVCAEAYGAAVGSNCECVNGTAVVLTKNGSIYTGTMTLGNCTSDPVLNISVSYEFNSGLGVYIWNATITGCADADGAADASACDISNLVVSVNSPNSCCGIDPTDGFFIRFYECLGGTGTGGTGTGIAESGCDYCSETPLTWEVTASGFSAGCSSYNGTFTLTQDSDCVYSYTISGSYQVVLIVEADAIRVYFNGPYGFVWYSVDHDGSSCCTPLTLSEQVEISDQRCGSNPATITATPSCSSGTGTGTGTGTGSEVACCPGKVIPNTLYLTFGSPDTGECCFSGQTFELTYQGDSTWSLTTACDYPGAAGSEVLMFTLRCAEDWTMTIFCFYESSAMPVTTAVCEPLELTWTNADINAIALDACCNGGASTISFTVTE